MQKWIFLLLHRVSILSYICITDAQLIKYISFLVPPAVALALTLDVRAIPVVLQDPIAAKVEDAATATNIAFRHPVARAVVARMERPALVTRVGGISV